MSITDELRRWVGIYEHEVDCMLTSRQATQLLEVADRIDAEHRRGMATAQQVGHNEGEDAAMRDGWAKLPVDADGVPIHVGDRMDFLGGMTVSAIGKDDVYFFADNYSDGVYTEAGFHLRHHHEPTVEDVLREFAEKVIDSQIPSVHPTYEEAIAEFAAKLRLVGDAE